MSKDARKALMIAKGQVSSGYLPPGDPQRTANLSKFMEGAHPEVLNKDGSPKTLYHGSIEPNLKRLDPRKAVEVEGGSFLTNNPDVAHQYTYERAYGDIIGDEPLGEVHHVHVNMRNPYIHPTKPGQKIVDAIEMGRAVDHAKKHGHDGVIVKNIDDSIGQTGDMGDTYVAFHPTQIKSATGNNGQYDPSNPEIHKAEGGEAEQTIPEAPHTLAMQLQAFLQGKRKAVLYTHDEPELPKGAGRLETAHGVFHYNPALIDEPAIKDAVAGDRINDVLGIGPYSKRDVLNRVVHGESPLAVVGRDAGGREVLSAAGTDKTAPEQAAAIAPQLPPGGQVSAESPANVLFERIAAMRSPEQGNKDARKTLMIARAMGGRIAKAAGGMVDTNNDGIPDRQLDQSGFYNAAAEAAQAIPQAKGTPQQMMSMVQKVPGTQETMKWSGADQAFAGQPIVSKDDLVKHFQTNAPKLEEKTFTGDNVKWGSNKNLNLVIPGGENYREVLLHLPPTKKTEYRHKVIRADGHVDSTYDSPESSAARANEIGGTVRRDDPFTVQGGYRSSHWFGHPNVVAHLRMSDRTLPKTGEKALHLEEVQSDWGQDGSKGFKKSPEELASMKADMLAAHKNFLNLVGPVSGATEDQIQAAEDKSKAVMNKWNKASKATTPEGPYVGNTNKWTDLALKRALIEAARGGHDKLIWTPGEEQALRYKEDDEENDAKRLNGMNKYYGEIVPSRLEKILQSIGHKAEFGTDYIKVKPYGADLDVYKKHSTGKYHVSTGDKRNDPDAEDMEAGPFNTHEEAVAHRDLLYKGLKAVPSLKITPAMRETISKGLPRKTGGFVPPARSSAVEQALKLTSKSGATLPAAVFLARQH